MREMQMGEVEAALERVWDLHDRISDAIHSISRAHFLRSVRTPRGAAGREPPATTGGGDAAGDGNGGFVFVKDSVAEEDGAAMAEARSLTAIRSALENLEDQLVFFHTVHSQQRAEWDAAIARLEQSRIILSMRLADHQGKKYRVIEEALAFVGDVHGMGHFVTPETLYDNDITRSRSGKNLEGHDGGRASIFMQIFISSFDVAKKSFRLVRMNDVLGSAAVFAVSVVALLQLNQVALKGGTAQIRDQTFYRKRNERSFSRLDNFSSSSQLKRLDVLSARG